MADITATIEEIQINATIVEEKIEANIDGTVLQMNGLVDSDYGDIAVSNNGSVMTIENMGENATVTTGTYVSKVNQDLLIKVRKATSGTITKGQAVYIVGSTGNHLTVELARADVEATSAYTIGIAATTITSSNDGFVIQNGRLTGLSTLPTATYTEGQTLYLSETTAGGYRVGIPQAPNHGVLLGFVIRTSNGNAGELDVRVQNYQELEELSDVYINNKTTNDFLIRKATRWENITSADVKNILAINNVDNTSDLNKPISTATQTALDTKQAILQSGTNIKTINNQSVLGSGNLTVTSSAQWGNIVGTLSSQTDLQNALDTKVDKIVGKGLSTEDYTTTEKNKLAGISGTNTGDQNLFSTIAVAGQSNVVADSTSDTLTLVGGSNVSLTTNATNDSITINSIASPGGSNNQIQFNNNGTFGGVSTFTTDGSGNIALTGNLTSGTLAVPYTATGTERYVNSAFANFNRQFGMYIEASGNEGGFKADSTFQLKGSSIGIATTSGTGGSMSITTATGGGNRFVNNAARLEFGTTGHINIFNGPIQSPFNSGASNPTVSLSGTWFTGGTSTTTKPHMLIEPTGTTSTNWSTAGTGLGINAPAGFTGDLAWFGVGGVRQGVIKSDGSFQFGRLGAFNYSNGFIVTTDLSGVAYSGYWGSDKLQVHPSMAIAWGSVQGYDGETLALHRDAAHILAQRIGTNAQTTRIYNTFTSATNFERAKIEWSSNILRIGTEKGSAGGTARDMELQTDAITRLAIDTVGSIQVATALTVATLPAAPVVGMVARVTDATAPVMGATVVGGGAAAALVWYNGANWTVIGV